MAMTIETCTHCNALVEQQMMWQHQGICNASHDSGAPCAVCGAVVFNWEAHNAFHRDMAGLKDLLNRLLGDVEAHLQFIASEA